MLKPISKGPASTLREAHQKLDRTLVSHQRFDEAVGFIRARLLFQSDSKLLFVVGPSGVGKTRAYSTAQKIILDLLKEGLFEDLTRIPYVAFEVGSTSIGNFAWGPFYHEYQKHLRMPLVPSKAVLDELPFISKQEGPHEVLVSAINHRRPYATLLDEANHLCQVANPRLIAQQLNKIKSLANKTGVLHIMFGTYELAAVLDASEQLARRGDTFHFARYRKHVPGEMGAFSAMVKRFQGALPFHHTIDLCSNIDFIYERCIGCGGTLKTWLVSAMSYACRNNRDHITFDDMVATAMAPNKLRVMLHAAQRGEELLDDRSNGLEVLRLMIDSKPGDQQTFGLPGVSVGSPKRKGSPIERNPSSDPVGGAFATGNSVAKAS